MFKVMEVINHKAVCILKTKSQAEAINTALRMKHFEGRKTYWIGPKSAD